MFLDFQIVGPALVAGPLRPADERQPCKVAPIITRDLKDDLRRS
jgi:hypothetical protein